MSPHPRLLALMPGDMPILQSDFGIRLQPRNPLEVQQVIQAANTAKTRLYPWLGQTQPMQSGVFLDLERMHRVINFRDSEFLIHVEAGMTLGELQAITEARGQRLPLRFSPARTVLNVLGETPHSLTGTRFDPMRHWVMGTTAITGDGQSIHYGGEIVKNVTGYDLNKLFCGSQHRYSLLVSAILRLEPLPEASRSFLFHVEDFSQALDISRELQRHVSQPEILSLFKTKTTFGWHILVTLSGYTERVEAESESVRRVVGSLKADLQEMFLPPKALDQWIQRLDWTAHAEPDALVLKVALGQTALLDLPPRYFSQGWFKGADMLLPTGTQQMLLRWISVNMPSAEELAVFQADIQKLGGFVEVLRTPSTGGSAFRLPLQDPSGVLYKWESRLKNQYDPNGVLGGTVYHERAVAEEMPV